LSQLALPIKKELYHLDIYFKSFENADKFILVHASSSITDMMRLHPNAVRRGADSSLGISVYRTDLG